MNSGLKRLIRDRKVLVSGPSRSMVLKELAGAAADLKNAAESVDSGNDKWAIVQAYYSAFHSARALLYAKGLRERGHRGLLTAIRELYAHEVPASMLEDFANAMSMREAADYGLVYSTEGAYAALETAKEFLRTARRILRNRRAPSHRQQTILPYLRNIAGQPKARKQRTSKPAP